MKKFYYNPKPDCIRLCFSVIPWIVRFIVTDTIIIWFYRAITSDVISGKPIGDIWSDIFFVPPSFPLWIIIPFCGLFAFFTVREVFNIYRKTFFTLSIDEKEVVCTLENWPFSSYKKTIAAQKIRSCTQHQDWIQKLCNTMNISITTSGDRAEICFEDIISSQAREAHMKIDKLAIDNHIVET